MSITCPQCGHENQIGSLYCDECGEELKMSTSSSEEDETSFSEESFAEASSSEAAFDEEQDETSLPQEEDTIESESTETEEFESVSTEMEETEQSPSSLPVGAATRLELDEPPIEKIVSPATTLELPELPTAVLTNQETGEKFTLPSGEQTIYIGRLNDEFPIQVDLSGLPNSDLISRVHAAIHLENEVYYLEDAGSANGTWLNETKIEPGIRFRQQLNPGDTIAFGRNQTVKLTFDLED